jgi:hypothetical protein
MPELDDLETLADDVRASAPRPSEAYVTRLEQRAEAGFPRQRAKKERSWFLGPGLALASCVLIALVFGVAALDKAGSGDEDATSSGGGSAEVAPEAPRTSSAPADENRAAPLLTEPGPQSLRPGARKVEQRTAVELTPGSDGFAEVTAGVLRIADGSETIVQRSSVSERDGRGFATYDLRVPTSELDGVLAELSELAPVKSRTASSRDITAASVSAADRLTDAREERRALLRALARADSDREAGALRARLADARRRVARAERDVRRLRARADRARVDVTVASTGREGDGGAWTPRDALDDAGRVLEVALGIVVVVSAVLLPFALLLALAAAAARLTRRRRREAALG